MPFGPWRFGCAFLGWFGRQQLNQPGSFEESDADCQSGFDGGPLVDLQGRVLGLLVTSVEKDGPPTRPAFSTATPCCTWAMTRSRRCRICIATCARNADKQVPLKFFRNGQVTTSQVTLGGR